MKSKSGGVLIFAIVIILIVILLFAIVKIRRNGSEITDGGGGIGGGDGDDGDDGGAGTGGGDGNDGGNLIYTLGSGDYAFSLQIDDLTRKYFVHVPNSYDKSETPMIINFHGGGGGATGIAHQSTTKMNDLSDREGFIVIYPQGTRRDGDSEKIYSRFWNPGDSPGGPYYASNDPISEVDDIKFVKEMLKDIHKKFNIDEDRIYATGLSNGGILAHLLACELPDISAIAPIAAPFWTYPDECNPSKPISVILFHGTADVCAPYNGGISQCSSEEAIDRNFISAQETVNIWKDKNGCSDVSEITYQNGDVTCETWNQCDGDSEVTLCTIEGGGHTWPGGRPYTLPGIETGETSDDINANEAMWEFFEK